MQDAIAADAGVEDGAVMAVEARGQNVRPAVIGIGGGSCAVGDGIPECDDCLAVAGGKDIDAGEEDPGGDVSGIGDGCGSGLIARADVAWSGWRSSGCRRLEWLWE